MGEGYGCTWGLIGFRENLGSGLRVIIFILKSKLKRQYRTRLGSTIYKIYHFFLEMALSFLVGEEPMMGLSLTTFLQVQLYMEMLAILGLGAIFLRMWSLFFLAMSSFTNSLDLSMILLIFYICFFFIYSLPLLRIFLFQLSSLTGRRRVLDRELVLVFLTGESLRERANGFCELVLGKMLVFQMERIAAFFLSSSFLIESYRELSYRSPKNFSQFLRQFSNCGNRSLFFFSSTQTAKMKPRLYLSIMFSTMLWSYFSGKSLLFFLRVAAWMSICPSAIQSSSFLISFLLLLKQYIFSFGATSQSLSLISSSWVTTILAGESAPWTRLF